MKSMTIGTVRGDYITVGVHRFLYPATSDSANWVQATVDIHMTPWQATYEAQLESDNFAFFRMEVEELYQRRRNTARFEPTEPWLSFTLEADDLGHLSIVGSAGTEAHFFGGVVLKFKI